MGVKLTTKQRLFCEAYISNANGNATEAARIAGYKGNDVTLGAVGAENLKKPLIAEMCEKRVTDVAMSTDEWLLEVTELARTAEKQSDRIAAYGLLGKPLNLTNNSNLNLGGKVEIGEVLRPANPNAR